MGQYIGIADAHGIESFISLAESALEAEIEGQNGQKSVAQLTGMLLMRAEANRQRHAVVYRVEVDESDARRIKRLLAKGKYASALRKLKKCAQDIEIGKRPGMEKSWSLIPNPGLDPYSD